MTQDNLTLDETISALWHEGHGWSEQASRLQLLADSGFPDGSRLFKDNAGAIVGESSLAVSRYVQERLWNVARTLRSLYQQVFATEPGRLHLDATIMYPLLRAAIEDATTVYWLQTPEDASERIARSLRALFTDAIYFTENHLLLASASMGVSGVSKEMSDALSKHMAAEQVATRTHFEHLAAGLGLDVVASTRKLATSAPIKAQYGDGSIEFVTWKFLSDLSHFSYMMLKHLATTPIPGSAVPLKHVMMLHFSRTVNQVCGDAARQVEQASRIA